MSDRRLIALMALALAPLLVPISGHPQEYPAKPVRLVTAEPGGGHDLAARLIAQGLTASLGQQFIVDNRAGNIIAGEYVAKAPPDGYTLMIYGSSLWLAPFMRSSVPYDVIRDFAPIGLEVNAPILVVVHPSLPVKTVRELIALAKGKPGVLDYATGQTGASTHLASELFPTAGSVAPHLKSGRVRALAVTSAKPSALFPGLPTVASAGLPGYECDSMIGAFAPARVPPAIINRLSKEMAAAVNKPEIKERFAASGVETVGSPPEALAAAVKSEMARLGKLIGDLHIREEAGRN